MPSQWLSGRAHAYHSGSLLFKSQLALKRESGVKLVTKTNHVDHTAAENSPKESLISSSIDV